jgi:hypothetical protein
MTIIDHIGSLAVSEAETLTANRVAGLPSARRSS